MNLRDCFMLLDLAKDHTEETGGCFFHPMRDALEYLLLELQDSALHTQLLEQENAYLRYRLRGFEKRHPTM